MTDSAADRRDCLLRVRDLNAWYDESHVLHGVDLDLADGEVVTLLGRNGAGKSTTLKAIMGMLPGRAGSIEIAGAETIGLPARRIARMGVAYCPENRGIFSSLTVLENLLLPPVLQPDGLSMDDVLGLFPNLRARLNSQGTKLSGGEQQMLAIARILRTGSRILLLDEPTEGLAPVVVQEIGHILRRLRARRYTILLVEQNYRFAAAVADRHYVMANGRIVDMIRGDEITARQSEIKSYLGV
ncbi:ABC transporter ATP-binding protein [Phreatobacter stygius]|uniref:ABC transporter ATP-binding protein n=1 Tax=Phreatobacter stygius TaxID=1940610 RepID=A0A4D7B422_9HYPH|nr:ABC transporter ATP-binding protein [Phreatobacter stygius]QCI64406.1 ABC transporter ATP-binding protein [Phreatobacter stygius]